VSLFVLLCLALYGVERLGDGQRGAVYIAVHVLLTACMIWAWHCSMDRSAIRQVLVAGIAARLFLIGVTPFTTHDTDRYLWDGQVAWQGLDPYSLSPSAPQLETSRARWPTPPEHEEYATVYPPLAVAIFAVISAAGPAIAPIFWKTMVALASIVALLFARNLVDERQPRHFALFALSPLVVLEGGVGAHLDILTMLCMALGLWFLHKRRPWPMSIAVASGVLIKFLPGVLLIAVTRRQHFRRHVVLVILLICSGYMLAKFVGWESMGTLFVFLRTWEFGNPAAMMGLLGRIALASVALAAAWRAWVGDDGTGSAMWVCVALLLQSKVVFPWYLLTVAPFLLMRPTYFLIGWMVMAPLTYEVIDGFDSSQLWEPALWPMVLIALGWAAGAALDRFRPLSTPAEAL
jgi:hypothetical protein